MAHLVERIGLITQPIHLRPAGDAGLDPMATEIAVNKARIMLVVGHRMRARPDKRHAATQHIQKLWQFIQTGPP